MSHSNNPNQPPCRHMEKLLQETASGRTRGFRRWFTLSHAKGCGRCGRFLGSLQGMVGKLRTERTTEPAPDVLNRLAEQVRQTNSN